MKSILKRIKPLAILLILFFSNNLNAQVVTFSDVSTNLKKTQYDVTLLEINAQIKNNSNNKIVTSVVISAYFRDKRASSSDITAQSKAVTSESNVTIISNDKKQVSFLIYPPNDINMAYKSFRLERVVFSDGTFIDY